MLFPPKSVIWTKDFWSGTKRRGGWETKSVSPNLNWWVAKYILGNLVFLTLHGGLRICLNNLEKSHYDVYMYKELPGHKTGKRQVLYKLHLRVPIFPPSTTAMFFPNCHQQHAGRNKNRNSFANTWKEDVLCSGTAIWRVSPARLD